MLAAPTINIVRTPLWGREPETFGEDPFLTGQLVAPEIRGIQTRQAFQAAIQQGGAASVMCSYNQINGTPSC